MSTIKVTPFNDSLIENGIYLSERFDDANLRKCNWPKASRHRRVPEGGTGGEFFAEDVKIQWKHDKLIFPIGEIEVPIAERNHERVTYHGSFILQMDSDVAYYPERHLVSLHSKDFIIFVCAKSTLSGEPMFRAIKVPHGFGIVVEANIAHSMPIPLHDNSVEFKVYHRSVNAVAQFKLKEALNVNVKDIDDTTPITILKAISDEDEPEEPHHKKVRLPLDFSSELLHAQPANISNFKDYGTLIEGVDEYEETVSHVSWPIDIRPIEFPGLEYQPSEDSFAEANGEKLVQDFKMTWINHYLNADSKILKFNGLSGSFAGAEGKPGVEYNKTTSEYKVDVLMTRPDGSFYIHAKDRKSHFLMVFAKPDEATGEPIKSSLKVFHFSPGQGARLEAGYWHSVPVPHSSSDSVEFREVVAETNANIVANVHFESNGPLRFKSI